MTRQGRTHYALVPFWAILCLLTACVQAEDVEAPSGRLRLSLAQPLTGVSTRAVPAELPAPVSGRFQLVVRREATGSVAYEGRMTDELQLRTGDYTITATHGDNPPIGRDTPYYVGIATATVSPNELTTVQIPCRVANALVSVQFGSTPQEAERFSRHYSDYGLLVHVGQLSMAITPQESATSIYFPAGSQPQLEFYGTLRNDGRTVSMPVTHEHIPTTFQAADHASLVLTLPNPESAMGVFISKAKVETVTLDETIPLSWLPVPSATATHVQRDGLLVGTDLQFSMSYPGMTWEARVSNEQGDTVRRVAGQGALTSPHTSSADWAFLPRGKYKATYFLHSANSVSKVGSREFQVGDAPMDIVIGGYTSYDKYLDGDIDAANQCDGYTLYQPQVCVLIASSLTVDSKYGFKLTSTLKGNSQRLPQNPFTLPDATFEASLTPHRLTAQVDFAGQTATNYRDFRVTGIPFDSNPPTTSTWAEDGTVREIATGVRLGQGATEQLQTLTYNRVAIPAGTSLMTRYHFECHSTWPFKATGIFVVGQQTIATGTDDDTVQGETALTAETDITSVQMRNEGGLADTWTDVFRVALRYNNPAAQ